MKMKMDGDVEMEREREDGEKDKGMYTRIKDKGISAPVYWYIRRASQDDSIRQYRQCVLSCCCISPINFALLGGNEKHGIKDIDRPGLRPPTTTCANFLIPQLQLQSTSKC